MTVCIEGKDKLINDVHFAPVLAHNLISVGQLIENGLKVEFENNAFVVKKQDGEVLLYSKMTGNRMFLVDFSRKEGYMMMSSKDDESRLWHYRYVHLYVKVLQLLTSKKMVNGLPIIKDSTHVCEGCVLGKQTRRSIPKGQARRATEKLEIVCADICGPMRTESHSGSKYFLLFIDDFTRLCWVYFIKAKSEAFEYFKKFKALVRKQGNGVIKILGTDRGGEFMSKEFTTFREEGIRRELTGPYTPEQNGITERKNRTIVEMARSMLKASKLSDSFWAEAAARAVYLLNLSPTKAVWNKTPFEA